MNAQALDAAIRAVCPIAGVSDDGTISFDPANPPTAAQRQAAQAVVDGWADPSPSRTVAFTALVDALSSEQYAAINARDRDRMQSENDGVVPISSSKVTRAATALGLTPDALFKLAGA